MSEHHTGPAEVGAPMDYKEHEKTYDLFIAGTKYGTVLLVVLMIAMAAGFFGGIGFIASILLFIILSVIGIFMMR